MARTQRVKVVTDWKSGVLDYDFLDNADHVKFDMHKLEPHYSQLSENGKRLFIHGARQKLGDSYADPDSVPRHETQSLYAELLKGIWSQRAESGGPRVTILAIALANLSARKAKNDPKARATDDEVTAMVERLDGIAEREAMPAKDSDGRDVSITGKEYIKQLQTQAVIKAEMESIKAQRATAKAAEARKAAAGATVELPF